MAPKQPMKDLFRWFRRNRVEHREKIDLDSIAPLVHMVEPAEPDADLLSRIEHVIGAQAGVAPKKSNSSPLGRKTLIGTFITGMLIGLSGAALVPARQDIVAQTGAASPWIPLGSVTLHGSALRSFVRAKCEGQTHFFITMHGFHSEKDHSLETAAPLLMEKEEKIRMECIF